MAKKKEKRKFKVGDLLIRIESLEFSWADDTQPWYKEGQLLKITRITPAMYFYEYLGRPQHPNGNATFREIETTCAKATGMAKSLYGRKT